MTIKQALKACEKHAPNESIIITHRIHKCVSPVNNEVQEDFRIATGFSGEIQFATSTVSLADCVEQFLATEK